MHVLRQLKLSVRNGDTDDVCCENVKKHLQQMKTTSGLKQSLTWLLGYKHTTPELARTALISIQQHHQKKGVKNYTLENFIHNVLKFRKKNYMLNLKK